MAIIAALDGARGPSAAAIVDSTAVQRNPHRQNADL